MAFPLIPQTTTLNITSTFSPPTTCFDPAPTSTYTLAPAGTDSAVSNRLVIKGFATQCYPDGINQLGLTSLITSSAEGSFTRSIAQPTASFFSAESCPEGFQSATAQTDAWTTIITCCPSGDFVLEAVGVEDFSGCVQIPTAPVTLIAGSTTTTLSTPSGTPFGISYRALTVGFVGNESATSPSASPSTTPSNAGLSTGAQAGIGVGVSLGVIALILLGVLFWWLKRRKSKSVKQEPAGGPTELPGGKSVEVPAAGNEVHELGHNEILEAGHSGIDEKAGYLKDEQQQAPVELEGDWRGWEVPDGGLMTR